jgi:hypothetical protein
MIPRGSAQLPLQLLGVLPCMPCDQIMCMRTKGLSNESRAIALLRQFEKSSTLLALKMALTVFQPLEQLNKSMQSSTASVSGLLASVEIIKTDLNCLRRPDVFTTLLHSVETMAQELDLEPLTLPRKHRVPKRLSGPAAEYQPETVEEHFRKEYFSLIDAALVQLEERFSKDKPGLQKYMALEDMLILGEVHEKITEEYPELDRQSLEVELRMFRHQFQYRSVSEAQECMQKMAPDVQLLFSQVKELLILLLVCPASSASAERSFSQLRKLKTWLRSTMGQSRLNCLSVCHTHQEYLDEIDLVAVAKVFVARNDYRQNLFGRFE